jgi:hypothetical protein
MAFLLSVVAYLALQTFTPASMPEPETGNIGGHPAVLFWPTPVKGTFSRDELPAAEGCEVHAISKDSGADTTFPCGSWYLPKDGSYVSWIDSSAWISNQPMVFRYGTGPFNGFGTRIIVPVVPLGTVKLIDSPVVPPDSTVRLLSLDSPGYPLERRVTVSAARGGVHMPARRVIAGIFDGADNAIALSHPFTVTEGHIADLSLPVMKNVSAVLAVLARPSAARGPVRSPADVYLEIGEGHRSPDFIYNAPSRVYAIWYDIAPGIKTAILRLDSEALALDPVKITLTPGHPSTVRREISLR